MAKLKSAIIATVPTVIWLAFAGGVYACSVWLTPEPFATAAECDRALAEWQYRVGHHDEYCAELESGGWCAHTYDTGSGTDHCFMP